MRPTPSDYRDLETTSGRGGRGGSSVRVVDGALVIKNIQKGHEGYYLCKASNGIGGISAVAKIAVQGEQGGADYDPDEVVALAPIITYSFN